MATVPLYKQQVDRRPIADVRYSSPASPEMLGASAQSLQRFGRNLQQAGSQFGQIAYRIQERDNADRVMRAEAALKTGETDLHNTVKNRRGHNAIGATHDAAKWWQEAEKKYSEPLTNDAQQRAFRELVLKHKTSSLSYVSEYEAKQRRQSLLDSSRASIASSIDAAAAAYDSPEAVNLNRKRVVSTVSAVAKLEGWDPETAKQQQATNLTMLHKRVIEAQLEDDPLKAEEYYQAHKEDIKGSDRAVIKEKIRQASTLGKAQKEADRIMAKVPKTTDQLAEARKIKDPETRKTAEILIKQYQAQTKAVREADQTAALDDTWRIIANGGDRNAIPQHVWTRLSGEGQKKVNDYLEKQADKELKGREVDDFAVLDVVDKKIEQGDITDPSQLRQYEPYLRDATLRTLRKNIAGRGEINVTAMRQAFEDRLGERRSKWNDSHREQWIAFQDYITANVRETKRPEDLESWADKWFMEGYGTKDRLLSNDPDTYGEAVTAGRKDFVIDTPDTAKADVLGAMDLLRRAGVEAPNTKLATDEFYTQQYLDAQRYLGAHDVAITPGRLAAYAYLRGANKPITIRNVEYVAGQLK